MSEARRPTPRLFQGLQPDVPVEDVVVGRQLRAPPVVGVPVKPAIDLSGKPKILFVIGRGRSGKTTFMRWVAEQALAADPHCTAIFSAVGGPRDLKLYFPNVAEPASYNSAQYPIWLERLITHCVTEQVNAAVDFDGGDETVERLVQQQDDLCGMMEGQGIVPVEVHMLSSEVTDLTTLATLEQSGFQPKATLLVLNEGTGDPTVDVNIRFGPTMGHAAFRSAQSRGAIVIHMPRLYEGARILRRQMSFADAEALLDVWDRGRLSTWTRAMTAAFAPVKTWLP